MLGYFVAYRLRANKHKPIENTETMKLYSAFNFFMQCLQKALCVLFAGFAIAGFAYFATYIAIDLLEMLNQ